ncbi:hypothetical protein NDU88_007455, partial [Pleurodeles waltl]
ERGSCASPPTSPCRQVQSFTAPASKWISNTPLKSRRVEPALRNTEQLLNNCSVLHLNGLPPGHSKFA